MSHHRPRQLPPAPVASASIPADPPPSPPAASDDGTAPPQTSNDPAVSDSQTSISLPSTSAQSQISLSTSILPSSASSDPSVSVPSSTSSPSPIPFTSLPSTTFSSTTPSLPPTSSSSPPRFAESTASQSSSSSTPVTSFTTIITTLSDGSVFSTVSPLPTSLQTKSNSNPSNSRNRVGIIAGTTTAVGLFILLLLSLIFCYRKKKLGRLWDSLDLRGGRARERRGLLEDEDFDDGLTHVRARSDISVSAHGPLTSRGGSINLSLGSAAGNSPVLSHASSRFISPAIPLASAPDPSTSYSPIRSSFPPATIMSTPSSINSSLPVIQTSQPPQNRAQMPNSYSTPNYMNLNSSVSSFSHSSPPVPTLFRPRASESGSIFREEGVWPPPNEKSNDFVDPFVGHVKKVSGDVGDELAKIVCDVMGPSGLGDSASGSISSPTPSQQPFYSPSPSTMTMLSPSPRSSLMLPRASMLSAPITHMTTAATGGTSGAHHFMGTTGLDDRSTGTKKQQGDSPTWKSTDRRNMLTPSPSSSPEPSIAPLPAPPPAMANAYPKGTSMGLSPHDTTTVFSRHHYSSSSLSLSLPPGAAPAAIPGLSPVIPTPSTSTMRMSPTSYTVSPTSPMSAGTTNTASSLNTNSLATRGDAASVPYKYKDGEMPSFEEDFGWGGGGGGDNATSSNNNTRRTSGDRFEFVRGEKVDREVVGQELGILKEGLEVVGGGGGGGGGKSFSPPSARKNSRLISSFFSSTAPTRTHTTTSISPSSSLTLSPTSSPTLNSSSQVKKPSPLKQQTLAD